MVKQTKPKISSSLKQLEIQKVIDKYNDLEEQDLIEQEKQKSTPLDPQSADIQIITQIINSQQSNKEEDEGTDSFNRFDTLLNTQEQQRRLQQTGEPDFNKGSFQKPLDQTNCVIEQKIKKQVAINGGKPMKIEDQQKKDRVKVSYLQYDQQPEKRSINQEKQINIKVINSCKGGPSQVKKVEAVTVSESFDLKDFLRKRLNPSNQEQKVQKRSKSPIKGTDHITRIARLSERGYQSSRIKSRTSQPPYPVTPTQPVIGELSRRVSDTVQTARIKPGEGFHQRTSVIEQLHQQQLQTKHMIENMANNIALDQRNFYKEMYQKARNKRISDYFVNKKALNQRTYDINDIKMIQMGCTPAKPAFPQNGASQNHQILQQDTFEQNTIGTEDDAVGSLQNTQTEDIPLELRLHTHQANTQQSMRPRYYFNNQQRVPGTADNSVSPKLFPLRQTRTPCSDEPNSFIRSRGINNPGSLGDQFSGSRGSTSFKPNYHPSQIGQNTQEQRFRSQPRYSQPNNGTDTLKRHAWLENEGLQSLFKSNPSFQNDIPSQQFQNKYSFRETVSPRIRQLMAAQAQPPATQLINVNQTFKIIQQINNSYGSTDKKKTNNRESTNTHPSNEREKWNQIINFMKKNPQVLIQMINLMDEDNIQTDLRLHEQQSQFFSRRQKQGRTPNSYSEQIAESDLKMFPQRSQPQSSVDEQNIQYDQSRQGGNNTPVTNNYYAKSKLGIFDKGLLQRKSCDKSSQSPQTSKRDTVKRSNDRSNSQSPMNYKFDLKKPEIPNAFIPQTRLQPNSLANRKQASLLRIKQAKIAYDQQRLQKTGSNSHQRSKVIQNTQESSSSQKPIINLQLQNLGQQLHLSKPVVSHASYFNAKLAQETPAFSNNNHDINQNKAKHQDPESNHPFQMPDSQQTPLETTFKPSLIESSNQPQTQQPLTMESLLDDDINIEDMERMAQGIEMDEEVEAINAEEEENYDDNDDFIYVDEDVNGDSESSRLRNKEESSKSVGFTEAAVDLEPKQSNKVLMSHQLSLIKSDTIEEADEIGSSQQNDDEESVSMISEGNNNSASKVNLKGQTERSRENKEIFSRRTAGTPFNNSSRIQRPQQQATPTLNAGGEYQGQHEGDPEKASLTNELERMKIELNLKNKELKETKIKFEELKKEKSGQQKTSGNIPFEPNPKKKEQTFDERVDIKAFQVSNEGLDYSKSLTNDNIKVRNQIIYETP